MFFRSALTRLAGFALIQFALTTSSPVRLHAQWWDPVKILTGRSTVERIERTVEKVERAGRLFLHNPVDYLLSRPASLAADVCGQIPRAYEGVLRGRATQWHRLPPILVAAVQSQYAVDLTMVEYTQNAQTVDGWAHAFGNTLYFPRILNLRDSADLHLMLHELEHVVQYADATYGKSGKLCEYLAKAGGAALQHDAIDWERAADRKAAYLIGYAYAVMNGVVPLSSAMPQNVLRSNEVWIRNATVESVTFDLRSPTMAASVTLPPLASQVFRGAPNDSWFNVYISTPRRDVIASIPGGTRQHIAIRNDSIDVFHEPPRRALDVIMRLRSFTAFKSQLSTTEGAIAILKSLGLVPGKPNRDGTVSAPIAEGLQVTIWPDGYGQPQVYGVRWGLADGSYFGSNDSYFELLTPLPHKPIDMIERLRAFTAFNSPLATTEGAIATLRSLGLVPGRPDRDGAVSARIGEGSLVTLWPNSYNQPKVYGVRWGSMDRRYFGSQDSYFELVIP